MKKIGILGGISAASTAKYYETILSLYYQRRKDYYYPEIVIDSLNFQYFTDMENEGRTEEYIAYILKGLVNLRAAGADFAVMAANSPHSVLESLRPLSPLPILSIMDAVADEARLNGMKTLLLTGIRYTMQGGFYDKRLEECGIKTIVPNTDEQNEIDRIIFSELALGIRSEASRRRFLDIIEGIPADGVILGCTELPQLVDQSDTGAPLLDSLMLHCQKTLLCAES